MRHLVLLTILLLLGCGEQFQDVGLGEPDSGQVRGQDAGDDCPGRSWCVWPDGGRTCTQGSCVPP